MHTFGKLEVFAYIRDSEDERTRRIKLLGLCDMNERESREFAERNRDYFGRKAARYANDMNAASVEFVFSPYPTRV